MTKSEEAVIRYQIEREKAANARGHYRCEKELAGDPKCTQQCQECNEYYLKKLNKK